MVCRPCGRTRHPAVGPTAAPAGGRRSCCAMARTSLDADFVRAQLHQPHGRTPTARRAGPVRPSFSAARRSPAAFADCRDHVVQPGVLRIARVELDEPGRTLVVEQRRDGHVGRDASLPDTGSKVSPVRRGNISVLKPPNTSLCGCSNARIRSGTVSTSGDSVSSTAASAARCTSGATIAGTAGDWRVALAHCVRVELPAHRLGGRLHLIAVVEVDRQELLLEEAERLPFRDAGDVERAQRDLAHREFVLQVRDRVAAVVPQVGQRMRRASRSGVAVGDEEHALGGGVVDQSREFGSLVRRRGRTGCRRTSRRRRRTRRCRRRTPRTDRSCRR